MNYVLAILNRNGIMELLMVLYYLWYYIPYGIILLMVLYNTISNIIP